jgi:hypothetical protein
MNYSYQEELLENWPHRGEGSGSDDSCCVASEQAVRRDTLLEHWPKRKSSFIDSFDSDEDDAAFASISNKRHHHVRSVNFSGSSSLHVFERESFYLLQSLAYTKEDYDVFGKEALREGFRIKNLIDTAPYDSEAKAINHLLRQGVISREEMIGIEHFILGGNKRSSTNNSLKTQLFSWASLLGRTRSGLPRELKSVQQWPLELILRVCIGV